MGDGKVQGGTMHTPLWCAYAQGDGGGRARAKTHSLRTLSQEILRPVAEVWTQIELVQFSLASLSRMKVFKADLLSTNCILTYDFCFSG